MTRKWFFKKRACEKTVNITKYRVWVKREVKICTENFSQVKREFEIYQNLVLYWGCVKRETVIKP